MKEKINGVDKPFYSGGRELSPYYLIYPEEFKKAYKIIWAKNSQ